jgi:hypothetical protein
MSEVINLSVTEWRRKAREGTLSVEEMKAALAAIRSERAQAGAVSATSTTRKTAAKAKAAPIDSDALIGSLML